MFLLILIIPTLELFMAHGSMHVALGPWPRQGCELRAHGKYSGARGPSSDGAPYPILGHEP